MTDRICEIEGCCKPYRARGMCGMHYERWRKHGDIDANHRTAPAVDRFWSKVDKDGAGGCWLWTGATNADGTDREPYGHFWDGTAQVYSHRFSYELARGPIPFGLHLDHLCRVRLCCNPAHLEPVTVAVNLARGNGNQWKGKTHCFRGHEFTPENTRFRASGARRCLACARWKAAQARAA